MAYTEVQSCPQTFLDWSNRASSTCSRNTYHCVEDEESRIVEVCAVPLWIKEGHCPIYDTVEKDMNSRVCSGNLCPKEVYRSDAVYKYLGCHQLGLSTSRITSSSVNASTSLTTNNSHTYIIAVSLTSVLIVILLAILWIILWRTKKLVAFKGCLFGRGQTQSTKDEKELLIKSEEDYAALEKITPKELDADNDFISQCQEYLETRGNTLALIGKWGSGKRTLAAQIGIRLAKNNRELKIKIVRDRDAISQDLKALHSTVIIIHDPVKTWFTSKHNDEIIDCLSAISTDAKPNNFLIIAVFHCNDWDSFKLQIGNTNTKMEHIFPKRESICSKMEILTEMAKSKNIDISNLKFQTDERSIGDPLMMTLLLKNREFRNQKYLSDPAKFIFEKLKTLERSSEIQNQLAFKVMILFVLRDGEITKSDFGDISQHALPADLEKIDKKKYIDGCKKQLLDLFIEESTDRGSYRLLHDVITKCTFLAAMENHRILLFRECDPILIFDCIREKSTYEKYLKFWQLTSKSSNNSIGISTKIYRELAILFFQRTNVKSILPNSRLYEVKEFQDEFTKAGLSSDKQTK